jgi:GT2 family glycosyltransferase
MPRYLDAMGAALDADPGAGMAYTDAWILDDASRRIRRLKALGEFDPPERPPADPRALFRMLVDRNFIFVSVTLRRSVIEAVGPFRTDVLGVEDYELWLRLAAHGHRFVRVPAHLALYRRHAGQLSQDPLLMAAKQLAVFRVVLAEYRLGEPDRVLVERRLAGLERAVAAMEGRSRPRAAALRARRLLGRVKRRVLDRRIWRSEPPAEVSAVFGDLGAL